MPLWLYDFAIFRLGITYAQLEAGYVILELGDSCSQRYVKMRPLVLYSVNGDVHLLNIWANVKPKSLHASFNDVR